MEKILQHLVSVSNNKGSIRTQWFDQKLLGEGKKAVCKNKKLQLRHWEIQPAQWPSGRLPPWDWQVVGLITGRVIPIGHPSCPLLPHHMMDQCRRKISPPLKYENHWNLQLQEFFFQAWWQIFLQCSDGHKTKLSREMCLLNKHFMGCLLFLGKVRSAWSVFLGFFLFYFHFVLLPFL